MNKLLHDIRNRFVFYCPREEMQIRGGIQKKKKWQTLNTENKNCSTESMMSNTTLKSDSLSLKAEDFSNNNANLENVKKELNIEQE